jgi:biofilm PGA synthesis protein PgaD
MNENTLILTEHRLLPRLFDAALTLVAWGGFLFFLYARLWMQLPKRVNTGGASLLPPLIRC